MEKIFIKDKLEQIDVSLDSLSLGDFDAIGDFCAKKSRAQTDPLYKSAGCFFRPNYERGILLYSLIKRFEIKSVLEIGFGRGYASFCMAKAMCDMGFDDGKIVTVDPGFNEEFLKSLTRVFPKQWFDKLFMLQGTADEAFSKFGDDQRFDLIYIDGDHTAEAVKRDWENSSKLYDKFVLFDDYRLEDDTPQIEVRQVVDDIELPKELIMMDRRIFHDDRGVTDEELHYGQVLITNPEFDVSEFVCDW